MKREKKKMNRGLKALLIILIVILCIAIALTATYFILRAVGKSHFHPAVMGVDSIEKIDSVHSYDNGKTVEYNGKTYKYNENMIFLAFMGIDKDNLDKVDGLENGAGQSDANLVIALDTETGRVSLILIPRDSMTDIDILDENGKSIGLDKRQICLSYAYGDGKETSCQNTIAAMERILCGIEIENYYTLDLDGIGSLNDAIGGVDVVALETISQFTEGTPVTLWGDNAKNYVQNRYTTTFGDSNRRKRQIQYAKAFAAKAFSEIKGDFTKVADIYGAGEPYSFTNFDLSRVTYVASVLVENYENFGINDDNIYTLPGETVLNEEEGYMETHLDDKGVFEVVLNVFYNEQK